MFSVKHILAGGREAVWQSGSVRFEPEYRGDPSADFPAHPSKPAVILDTCALYGGTVFVMNESGKTVARYNLEGVTAEARPARGAGLPTAADVAAYGRSVLDKR